MGTSLGLFLDAVVMPISRTPVACMAFLRLAHLSNGVMIGSSSVSSNSVRLLFLEPFPGASVADVFPSALSFGENEDN